MLFEDDVIDSVIKYLENKIYIIRHRSSATEHGYDLVAESDAGVTLIIEAKGQTSSMTVSYTHLTLPTTPYV